MNMIMQHTRLITLLFLGSVVASCATKTTQDTLVDPVELSKKFAPPEETPKPVGTPLELGLAGSANVFCSALYVSQQQPAEAFAHSLTIFIDDAEQRKHVKFSIDQTKKSVTLSYNDTLSRSATFYGDCGCVIDTKDGIKFTPPVIRTTLANAASLPWPMGDAPEKIVSPAEVNNDSLQKAVTAAFGDSAYTTAFIILHKGKILAEKYAEGITKDTQLESWSMGKSLTATLIGRMIQQGYFKLDDRAPVPAWSKEGDPRKEIKISDLLQMSSGLQFIGHHDPEANTYTTYLDHWYIYTGAVDAFAYSYNRPLQYPVGSTGRYHNCDPLTLGYIMRRTLEEKDESYHHYPQQQLFDKIGIRKQVLEPDPYGNFLLSGYDYGTARNWSRLGLLYLQDGMWNGERLLPEGYSDFVSTKAPGWEDAVYGGMFWLNGEKTFPIPENSYYMAGAGGQYTFIIPDKDLVVVRLGHFNGSAKGYAFLKKSLATLMNALN